MQFVSLSSMADSTTWYKYIQCKVLYYAVGFAIQLTCISLCLFALPMLCIYIIYRLMVMMIQFDQWKLIEVK